MSGTGFRIAIVGGGPSGLTLGALLHKGGIPFTIYERGQKLKEQDFDKASGSLDMHQETGIAAIKECGLYDEFKSLTGDCTEAQTVADKEGKVVYADKGESSNRPEITRLQLIKLMLSCIPSSSIQWEHRLISARKVAPDHSIHPEVELDFGMNGKHTFDLVVGADGAWSKIRQLLTNVKPQYAGTQNITLNLRQVTTRYPHLAKLIGGGTFSALGDKHGIFSQRSAMQDSARIYIFMSSDDEHFASTTNLRTKLPKEATDQLVSNQGALFASWGSNLKELVAAAGEDETANNDGAAVDIKPLYRFPVGHSWEHKPEATIIGDAAHLMCPWAGEGVNLAMNDALQLSRAIIKAFTTNAVPDTKHEAHHLPKSPTVSTATSLRRALDALIREFEMQMVATAKVEAEGTLENGEMMFGSDNAAYVFAEFFKNAGQPPELA